MKEFGDLKNHFTKITEIEKEMRRYSKEEIQHIDLQKREINIVRIQLLSIFIVVIGLLHFMVSAATGYSFHEQRNYLLVGAAMLLVIVLHAIIYCIWSDKIKKNYIPGNCYVVSWYFCISLIWAFFLIFYAAERHLLFEFFLLNVVISLIPLMKTVIHLLCVSFLFLFQLMLLLKIDAGAERYQCGFACILVAFLTGRVLYFEFVRRHIISLRLANAEKEIGRQNERLLILQSLNRETVFEYSFLEDKIRITDGETSETKVIYNYIEKLESQYRSPANMDIREFVNVYREIIAGKKHDRLDYDYLDEQGNTQRSSLLFTTVYEGDRPLRLIGKNCRISGNSSVFSETRQGTDDLTS